MNLKVYLLKSNCLFLMHLASFMHFITFKKHICSPLYCEGPQKYKKAMNSLGVGIVIQGAFEHIKETGKKFY